jgi:hypothetical protein
MLTAAIDDVIGYAAHTPERASLWHFLESSPERLIQS